MAKKSKKIIQEALRAQLKNEGIFDAVSGVAQGIANVPRGIAGQFRLGQVNSKLNKSAKRMQKDWEETKAYASKKAEKMSTSKNPQVAQMGHRVSTNVQNLDQTMNQAMAQLNNVISVGSDAANATKSTEFDSGIGRPKHGFNKWMRSLGASLDDFTKESNANMFMSYMGLFKKGIDPNSVSPMELFQSLPKDRKATPDEIEDAINSNVPKQPTKATPEAVANMSPEQKKDLANQVQSKINADAGQNNQVSPKSPVPPQSNPQPPQVQIPAQPKKSFGQKYFSSTEQDDGIVKNVVDRVGNEIGAKKDRIKSNVGKITSGFAGKYLGAPAKFDPSKAAPQPQPSQAPEMEMPPHQEEPIDIAPQPSLGQFMGISDTGNRNAMLPPGEDTRETAPVPLTQSKRNAIPPTPPKQKIQDRKPQGSLKPKAGLSLSGVADEAEKAARARFQSQPPQKPLEPKINDKGEVQIGDSKTGESGMVQAKDRFGTKTNSNKNKRPSARRSSEKKDKGE